jgi:hypothetical protein
LHAGLFGRSLSAVIDACTDPPLVRKFLGVFRITAAKLNGSAESMRSVRSRCAAANYALGPFTAIVNTNPSELTSHYVMAMCGRPYGRDAAGWPDERRPPSDERYRLVAANPWACATFFEMFTGAWCEVFYGWPRGARKQRNPSCLFGQVRLGAYSRPLLGRGRLHVRPPPGEPAADRSVFPCWPRRRRS